MDWKNLEFFGISDEELFTPTIYLPRITKIKVEVLVSGRKITKTRYENEMVTYFKLSK